MSEITSSDLDESQESIFWCKKSGFPPFGGRLASLSMPLVNKEWPFDDDNLILRPRSERSKFCGG